MGKKILKVAIPAIVILGCLIAFIFSFLNINRKYPNPTEELYKTGQTLHYDGFELMLENSRFLTWEQMLKTYPNMKLDSNPVKDGTVKSISDLKLIFAKFKIKNVSKKQASLPLMYMVAETDTWHNGIPIDIFMGVNGDSQKVSLQPELAADEEILVNLPFLLDRNHFSQSDWENVVNLNYDILFDLYPKKIMFDLDLSASIDGSYN